MSLSSSFLRHVTGWKDLTPSIVKGWVFWLFETSTPFTLSLSVENVGWEEENAGIVCLWREKLLCCSAFGADVNLKPRITRFIWPSDDALEQWIPLRYEFLKDGLILRGSLRGFSLCTSLLYPTLGPCWYLLLRLVCRTVEKSLKMTLIYWSWRKRWTPVSSKMAGPVTVQQWATWWRLGSHTGSSISGVAL